MSEVLSEELLTDVEKSIHHNNQKLTADKIIQILDMVRDEASKSRRRWIWELMQNAKDVRNVFKQVTIHVELSQNELRFAHNGNPFSIENLTGLIQQVSSKPSDSSDENTTGKFGTGFITTHLLSDIIYVNGIVARPENKFRRFKIELDRSGKNSEELLPSIAKALNEIRMIDISANFPLVENYEQLRNVDHFDNEFIYPLNDEPSQKAAEAGVNDLVFTLPITMINIEKIASVLVINRINNTEIKYTYKKTKEDGNLKSYEVHIQTNGNAPVIKKFFVWDEKEVKLVCEVTDWTNFQLIDNNAKQPFLYRDFPLVGTEHFHFPFVLNGTTFFPTQKRDSILINEKTEKSTHNRSLIEQAIKSSISFADSLIEKGCSNLYLLANTQLPGLEMEDETKEWYKTIQQQWRSDLLSRRLVETEIKGENCILSDCFVPEITGNENEDYAFWNLVGEFFGFNKIPRKDLNVKWFNIINGSISDKETWGKSLIITRREFLKYVEETQSIDEIQKKESIKDGISWLNKLFRHLSAVGAFEELNNFKIVPNQYNQLHFLKPLFKESELFKIPDPVLDILMELQQDWRNEMINRRVDLLGHKHTERSLSTASEEINVQLRKDDKNKGGVIISEFLNKPNAQKILIAILKLITKDSKLNSFKVELFNFCKAIYHSTDDFETVESTEGFNFETAIKLSVKMVNNTINETIDINGLAAKLNKEKDSTIVWLDNYLRFLSESKEYKFLLEEGNIIPNRYGTLCNFTSLFNYGTIEHPLDDELISILKQLNEKEDWNKFLVADGIGISVKNTKTFADLGSTIMSLVAQIRHDDKYEQFREPLISLIDWCERKRKLASYYLTDFDTRKNSIFYILTMENNSIGNQIISLVKNQERFKLLVEISNSVTDINDLKQLIDIANRIGNVDDILQYAKDLEEEKADFNFKKELGEKIENAFAVALESEGLKADVKYQGIGSHDFEINNPLNGRKFFVEIKSHSAANLLQPIRMSMSQVNLANTNPDNFALCVIERPHQYNDVTSDHIKTNLKLIKNYETEFKNVFTDYQNFSFLATKPGEISLEFFDQTCKLKIGHTFINQNSDNFQTLIIKIKKRLMI